jgi:hypothetical protein
VVRVRRDGVIVGQTVQHRADAAADALNETARKAQLLEALFREFGIDEQRWVAGSIALREWTECDESSRREVRHGYIASSRVDVRLIDISRLGPILAEAAARTEAWWTVRAGRSAPRTRLTMRLAADLWRMRVAEPIRTRMRRIEPR